MSFVQEVGRDGEIVSFIPFYDIDYFQTYVTHDKIDRRTGDASLYAYLGTNSDIVEIDIKQIQRLAKDLSSPLWLRELPALTRLSLARLGGASSVNQLRLLEEFSAARVPPRAAKIARAAHRRNASDQHRVWNHIIEEEGLFTGDVAQPNPFKKMSVDDIFAWLYENDCSAENWVLGLRYLIGRISYDERLFEIITKLCAGIEISEASVDEISIIARGLEIARYYDGDNFDFLDMMHDYVLDSSIFLLSPPTSATIIINFIDELERVGKLDGLAVDIYMDQLSSETIDTEFAEELVEKILGSDNLYSRYADKSYQSGLTRLDVLQRILTNNPRLGLVVDERTRKAIEKM
jgi:hypothetical protein